MLEQVGWVAFDLEEIVAAFFHQGPGVRTLAVQRVGGDDFPIQRRRLGQRPGPALEPFVEPGGKGFRIHAGEHLIEDTAAGHFVEDAGAFLDRQPRADAIAGIGITRVRRTAKNVQGRTHLRGAQSLTGVRHQ